MSKASAAAGTAREIDDTLAEAHTSVAVVKFRFEWDWPEAEREFKRAIELNPKYPTARHWYATYLMAMERSEEAFAEIKRARELDPLSLAISAGVGRLLGVARQYDRAIEQLQKTIEMDPNFLRARFDLGLMYAESGRYDEAFAEFQSAINISGSTIEILPARGFTYGLAGKRTEALKVLEELNEQSKRRHVSAFLIAIVYIGLGEKNQALDRLEKAYEERNNSLPFLNVDPIFDSLRSDARFQDLLRRIGLPP